MQIGKINANSADDGFVISAKPAAHVGPGTLGALPGIIRAVGADQVVVVTDVALAQAPVIEKVLAVLADAGLPARLFAGVHPTPTSGDLAAGAGAVAAAAADAATTAAASASAAAVAAMLTPSAPLGAPFAPAAPHTPPTPHAPAAPHTPAVPLVAPPAGPSYLSGPHAVLQPSAPPAPTSLFASWLPASAPPAGARIALVAVGSGAPVDTAKGIAAASAPALPIVAVPVPAGTGAETSALGLIADPPSRAFTVGHVGTIPAAVILDPELAAGVPSAVIAGCGLDALTRALESYLALRPNPWSDGIALQVIRMVAASLPQAVMGGTDLAARSQVLLAAHMAGVAAASTGLGLCHAIGRSLGARWDIARGAALAMLLPEVLRFNRPARLERMADIAFALGVGDTHADTWLNAEAAIGAVTALRDDVGLNRRMSDFGITEADFTQISADTLADDLLASTPRPAAADDIHAILAAVASQSR